jgi:hypothetical protein
MASAERSSCQSATTEAVVKAGIESGAYLAGVDLATAEGIVVGTHAGGVECGTWGLVS